MNWIKTTWMVMGFSFVILVTYDVVAMVYGGKEASISWQIIEYSYESPAFVFSSGFLCGHLFWRMKDPIINKKES